MTSSSSSSEPPHLRTLDALCKEVRERVSDGMLAPLSRLLDETSSSSSSNLTPAQRGLIDEIKRSGELLLDAVRDVADCHNLPSSSSSSGPLAKRSEEVLSIPGTITFVGQEFKLKAKPGVTVDAVLDEDVPREDVYGDGLAYRQVLRDLLANAVEFTQEGSVRVRVSVERVDEGEDGKTTAYVIRTAVIDTGCGVSEEDVATLFAAPAAQGDKTTPRRPGSGLAPSRALVELLGGKMGYEPNPDTRGSIFWVSLRMRKRTIDPGEVAAVSDATSALRASFAPVASSKRILIAEDNLVNQRILTKALTAFGFESVDVVADGARAVEVCEDHEYDLVLMDISMPVLDGMAAMKEVRAKGAKMPILALTAWRSEEDMERLLGMGFDGFVNKPVRRQVLAEALKKWLM